MAMDERIVDQLQTGLLRRVREVAQRRAHASSEDILRDLPITYGDLVQKTMLSVPAIGIGRYLTIIGDRCAEKGKPRLDYLVMCKKTGRPGFLPDEHVWRKEVLGCYRCAAFLS